MRHSRHAGLPITLCIALLFTFVALIWPLKANAGTCDNLYIVVPPTKDGINDGGTIYLSQEMSNGRYPRAGYLPVGTFISITDQTKYDISKQGYFEFKSIGSNKGFIRDDSVKSISSLINNLNTEDIQINCDDFFAIIVPIHPDDDVNIFYKNESKDLSASIHFSRSSYMLVILNNNISETLIDDNDYYSVWFAEPGSQSWKEGYLLKQDHADSIKNTYRISYPPHNNITQYNTGHNEQNNDNYLIIDGFNNFITYILQELKLDINSNIEREELIKNAILLLDKTCGKAVNLEIDPAKLLTNAFSTKYGINYSKDETYSSEQKTINLKNMDSEIELLRFIKCRADSPSYTKRILLSNKDIEANFYYDDFKDVFNHCLVISANEYIGEFYDRMLLFPYITDEQAGENTLDYFSIFHKLRQKLAWRLSLHKQIGSDDNNQISSADQEVILELLVNSVTQWLGDNVPTGSASSC